MVNVSVYFASFAFITVSTTTVIEEDAATELPKVTVILFSLFMAHV